MNNQTRQSIRDELKNDHENMGYHAILANDPSPAAALTAMMNDTSQGQPVPIPMRLTLPMLWERLIETESAIGTSLVNKLKSVQEYDAPDAAALYTLMGVDGGVDISLPAVQEVFVKLEQAGRITIAERDAVFALCHRPASRAENLWGVPVAENNGTVDSLSGAVYEDNGERWDWTE